jgi:hypothetical protein
MLEQIDDLFGGVHVEFTNIERTRIKFNMEYCQIIPLLTYYIAKNKINTLFPYGDVAFIKEVGH